MLNRRDALERCIASVREQDYPAVEHMVVDGGSTDGSVRTLEESGVRFISERDTGIYHAMSKGVRLAQGDFIIILNSDDRFARVDALSLLVREATTRELDICHARLRFIDEAGRSHGFFGRPQTFDELLRNMEVAHPTVLVRRSVYESFGAFSEGFRLAADYEFLLRVWRNVTVGFVDDVVVDMQLGGASTTARNAARLQREAAAAALLHGSSPLWESARLCYRGLRRKLGLRHRHIQD